MKPSKKAGKLASFAGIFIASFLVVLASASAVEITSFDADYAIKGSDTHAIYTISFSAESPDNFSLDVPADSQINSIMIDNFLVQQMSKEHDTKKTITFPINSSGKAVIDFSTKSYIDTGAKNYFVADIKSIYPIDSIRSKVTLPESSFLAESKEQGGSVFPQGDVGTDGRLIYVEWSVDALKGNSFPMFIIYQTIKPYTIIIYAAIIIVLVLIAYFLIPKIKQAKNKKEDVDRSNKIEKAAKSSDEKKSGKETAEKENIVKENSRNESKDDEAQAEAHITHHAHTHNKAEELKKILSHLTEDEQQVVNILADREGHIEQGTLVIITGFSKAHLSRLLDELQRRKIIHKEKKGKKNIVWLKSHF
jgi:hypothetical protein